MASNQNQITNSTWMGETWVVSQVAPGTSTVVTTDSIAFLSPNTIQRTSNIPQTSSSSTSLPTHLWGTWDSLSSDGLTLTGHAIDGTPFQIVYDGANQITCTLGIPQHRRWGWSVALAVFGGTLAGAAAGRLAGSTTVGALAGLVGAATGTAAFAAAGPHGGGGGVTGTGPNATWVANDGGPVGRPQPGPKETSQPLKVVNA